MFIRLSFPYSSLEGFFSSLSDSCDKLVVYEHSEKPTNIHVHFYTEGCRIKPDAIKTRIKKHLHVAIMDKTKWSFKTAEDSNCIIYMSKGCLQPSYVKGFTQVELDGYKDRWEERSPETSPASKKSGPSQYDMAMEVYSLICAKYSAYIVPTNEDEDIALVKRDVEIYEDCVRFAIKVCHKYRKGFDKHSIQKVIIPAFVKFNNCKEQFVSAIVSNYFRFV